MATCAFILGHRAVRLNHSYLFFMATCAFILQHVAVSFCYSYQALIARVFAFILQQSVVSTTFTCFKLSSQTTFKKLDRSISKPLFHNVPFRSGNSFNNFDIISPRGCEWRVTRGCEWRVTWVLCIWRYRDLARQWRAWRNGVPHFVENKSRNIWEHLCFRYV